MIPRYAREEMTAIWSPSTKFKFGLKLKLMLVMHRQIWASSERGSSCCFGKEVNSTLTELMKLSVRLNMM